MNEIYGSRMATNSSIRRCSSYSLLHYCVIHQAPPPMSGDTARVMFTFRPLGQTSRRMRSPLSVLLMVLRVKALKPDSSLQTVRWWGPTLHKHLWGILVYRQLGTTNLNWQTMLHIQNGAQLCRDGFLSNGTSPSFPAIFVVIFATNHHHVNVLLPVTIYQCEAAWFLLYNYGYVFVFIRMHIHLFSVK